jgi:hypothetical protein
LERLRDDAAARTEAFKALGTLLASLPSVVDHDAPSGPPDHKLFSLRSAAARELTKVDPAFGRVFRRYAFQRGRSSTDPIRSATLALSDSGLSAAIADSAVSRTARIDEVLRGLHHHLPRERAHAARRARLLDALTPSLASQLATAADEDVDRHVRILCRAALKAHGLPS